MHTHTASDSNPSRWQQVLDVAIFTSKDPRPLTSQQRIIEMS
ncbi:hypothetical protein [Corynebacterium freiburgense]|nr:hypothetical protein [Corynebacterium freiburgense]